MIEFIHADNYEWLLTQPDKSFDSIVTDAPYGLGKEPDAVNVLRDWLDHGYHEIKGGGFMGKKWDAFVPQPKFWKECLRVLKPGGYLLSFFGTRTYDWGVMAIRIAGFEIRDQIAWVYGSGFPKSLDVSKAIDKAEGIEREDKWEGLGRSIGPSGNKKCDKCGKWLSSGHPCKCPRPQDEPKSDLAKQWSGWGTALKPAMEPIVVARKPLVGTVVENIQAFGTGAINIDECRIPLDGDYKSKPNGRPSLTGLDDNYDPSRANIADNAGRWPANLIHDGSDEVVDLFPYQKSGAMTKSYEYTNTGFSIGKPSGSTRSIHTANEVSAARFFYCAKASREERNRGLENFEKKPLNWSSGTQSPGTFQSEGTDKSSQNNHPTVKPVALMRYLVRLVTPKGGRVLDPFCGSGSTGIACKLERFEFVGIDITEEYIKISEARVAAWQPEPEDNQLPLFSS